MPMPPVSSVGRGPADKSMKPKFQSVIPGGRFRRRSVNASMGLVSIFPSGVTSLSSGIGPERDRRRYLSGTSARTMSPAGTVARSFECIRAHGDDAVSVMLRDRATAIASAQCWPRTLPQINLVALARGGIRKLWCKTLSQSPQ